MPRKPRRSETIDTPADDFERTGAPNSHKRVMAERPPPTWTPTKADIELVWTLVRQKLPRLDARIHEELVQQVLVARTATRTSPADPQAYLNGIVRNVVNDFWRDAGKSLQTTEPLTAEPMDGEAMSADEAIERIERRRMVHACLQSVPERFRAVVLRFDLEEKPIEEVAAELGICTGTVYNRLRRGRVRFAEAVHRYMARRRMTKDDLVVPVLPLVSMGAGEALPTESAPPPWHVRIAGWFGESWLWAAIATIAVMAGIALALLPVSGTAVAIAAEARAPAEPATPARLAVLAPAPASEGAGAPSSPPIGSIAPAVITAAPTVATAAPVVAAAAPAVAAAAPAPRPEWEWAQSIAVLARRGNFAAASASAAAFRRSHPRSMHLPFVAESLRAARLRGGPKGVNAALAAKG